VPGMGDEVQTMKAGLMEIADIFVINKAERGGANQLHTELLSLLNSAPVAEKNWKPPVVMAGNVYEPVAFALKIEELEQKIEEYYTYLRESGKLIERVYRRIMVEVSDALRANIMEPIMQKLEESGELRALVEKVKNKKADPYSAAEEIAKRFIKE